MTSLSDAYGDIEFEFINALLAGIIERTVVGTAQIGGKLVKAAVVQGGKAVADATVSAINAPTPAPKPEKSEEEKAQDAENLKKLIDLLTEMSKNSNNNADAQNPPKTEPARSGVPAIAG